MLGCLVLASGCISSDWITTWKVKAKDDVAHSYSDVCHFSWRPTTVGSSLNLWERKFGQRCHFSQSDSKENTVYIKNCMFTVR